MGLSIATNLLSLQAQRQQSRAQSDVAESIARLSSGLRINSAADDAAGLAIADRFTAQIRGTTQAGHNANDGISLAQTAEGALASIDANLQRMRELAVQAANATNSAADRASLQLEVAQLQSEIDRVATQTQFNGVNLLDGSFTAKAFQVGANAGQTIAMPALPSARTAALGVEQGFSIHHAASAANLTPSPLTVSIGGGPTIALGAVAADAQAIAAAINAGGIAGLSAVVDPTTVQPGVSVANASAAGTAVLTINGIAIAIAGGVGAGSLAGNRSAAVTAINAQSAATGFTAYDTGSGLYLYAPDGRNITTSYSAGSFTSSTVEDFGLISYAGSFVGSSGFSVRYVAPPGTSGDVVFSHVGFSQTIAIGDTGTPLAALDVSTVAGANAALATLDSALTTVDAARATLGAVQSRFQAATAGLGSSGADLAASRSRIADADFAAEAAGLSRAQVLQQAGTAMLAQANQLPTQVLALLKSAR